MLRHNIILYKPKVNPLHSGQSIAAGSVTQHSPQSLAAAAQNDKSYHLGKYAYALFLKSIEERNIVAGNYVFLTGALYPYKKEDLWKVVGIEQIHYMCHYDTERREPLPLQVVNKAGETKWVNPNRLWKNYMPDLEW